MLRRNIPGSIAVVAFIFFVVGYGISLNTHINWELYFKIIGGVGGLAAAVALITGFLPSSEDRPDS